MASSYAVDSFFRRAGYYHVPQTLASDDINMLNNLLDEEFRAPSPEHRTIRAADGRITKLYGILQRPIIGDAIQQSLVRSLKLQEAVRAILGPNVALTLNRHNHATNNYTGENTVRFHRDVLHYSRNIVSAIIYLDEARKDNGATLVIPGSQHEPFVGVSQPDGGGTWMDEHPEYDHMRNQDVAIEASVGDVLLFDGTLFHTLGENRTGDRRRSIALGFKAVDELVAMQAKREILVFGNDIYRGNDI